jgi:hypothetical protein
VDQASAVTLVFGLGLARVCFRSHSAVPRAAFKLASSRPLFVRERTIQDAYYTTLINPFAKLRVPGTHRLGHVIKVVDRGCEGSMAT